jgi:hypothetical protein
VVLDKALLSVDEIWGSVMSPAIGCGGESKRRTAGALKAHRTMCNSSCNSMSCDGANCDVSGSFTFVTFGPHGELLLLASDSFHYPREIRDGLRRGVILVTAAASRDAHAPPGLTLAIQAKSRQRTEIDTSVGRKGQHPRC